MLGKIDAPLDKMLDDVEWGEFRIEDVLEWQAQKEIDPLKIDSLFDELESVYPFYGQSTLNNGVISYQRLANSVLNNKEAKPTILIHSNNQNIVYLETPFYLKDGHGATSVIQCEKLNKINQMFIISAIDRVIKNKYSYNKKATKIELKNTYIKLPIKNYKVDFEFMERFINKLELERITKLKAYLTATGLDDYTLTHEEQKVIDEYDKVAFGELDATSIFNIKNTRNILSRDIVENSGETPYLCASSENNGVSSYISYNTDFIDKGNCIFIGGKTFVVSYQENDFYSNDSHNLALYMKDELNTDKYTQLYLATCVDKSLGYKYSWGNSISSTKIKKDTISLPVKKDKIDYETMETLISAIHKLVIKDMILYVDGKINTNNSSR